jgi:hypothetical protein
MVLEANNLLDYDEAIRIRNDAARLPQTMLAFLGASGRSVKIVCRGELLPDNGGGLPTSEEDIEKFHKALYATARKAYNAQLEITIDAIKPLIHRTVYMSVDPELRYREQAVPFYIDLHEKEPTAPATIDNDLEHYLMPGRTVKRTYILNYQFVLSEVMGRYFDLPDENRTAELLMQTAVVEPVAELRAALSLESIDKIVWGQAFGHGVDNLFVQSTRLLYLRLGIAEEWIEAQLADELVALVDDHLHDGMDVTDYLVLRHKEAFQHRGVGFQEQTDQLPYLVPSVVVAAIGHLGFVSEAAEEFVTSADIDTACVDVAVLIVETI